MSTLLSGTFPRNTWLRLLLIAMFIGLLFAPFLFPGAKALSVAAKICIFIVLVASYDLLLGYTGIVSFAHTMFFGIGAYGVAIASSKLGASWSSILLGALGGLLLSAALGLLVALFSLRVRAIFFSMITLAVTSAFQTLASQLSDFTGGEDGLSFKVPERLTPAFKLVEDRVLGVSLDGKLLSYYLVFLVSLLLFVFLLRVVSSPFGRVLQAVRENEFRAQAIGFEVVRYRALSTVISAMVASLAGSLLALWLRYNGPDTSLSFEIMIDILLIVVIGGMGTLYGAVIGSGIFLVAQGYLQDLLKWLQSLVQGVESLSWLAAVLTPDRWLFWLGLLFVLAVYFFPTGVVGRLEQAKANKQ